jgi:DNA-binding HxlR family transcriptional regulator
VSTPTTTAPILDIDIACPATRTLVEHITSKWGVLVLLVLRDTVLRWSELKRKLPGVSEKMLVQTLQTLENDGLVAREARPVVPPHVEYSLTDAGQRAADLVAPLVSWAQAQVRRDPAG